MDDRLYNAEWLREKYWGEGLKQREIADILGCGRQAVTKWMGELDVKTRNRGHPNQHDMDDRLYDEEWLRQEYVTKHRYTTDMANQLECSVWRVNKALREHDIEIRSRGFSTGENHPLWKGGKPDYYGESWYQARRDALGRDNHTCQRCGIGDGEAKDRYKMGLNVHHITPVTEFKDGDEFDHEAANGLSNLITLCKGCHKKLEGLPIEPPEATA